MPLLSYQRHGLLAALAAFEQRYNEIMSESTAILDLDTMAVIARNVQSMRKQITKL